MKQPFLDEIYPKRVENVKLCYNRLTKYSFVSLTTFNWNFPSKKKIGRVEITFLPSVLLTIQNSQKSHVTITLSISTSSLLS